MIRKPSLTKQNEKVLIVGFGESMNRTPFDDPSFDLYTLNAAHRLKPNGKSLDHYASLWFQMHRPGTGHGHIDDPDHRAWLCSWQGCPIFMPEAQPWAPSSQAFPLREVTANCGPGRHLYASSIDFMVAYAIYQEYREIHLYGVDMLTDNYQARKTTLSYYLGVAVARGIALSIPAESSLLKYPFVYCYEEPPEEHRRLIAYIEGFVKDCDLEKQKALDESQLAYGRAREAEGQRKAYRNIIEVLKLRDNGSTL